jgi:peptidyl-prolyl cis-trans isomerase C
MDEQKRFYLTAKVSTELFQLNPQFLSSVQRAEVDERVERICRIQTLILNSSEAEGVDVSPDELERIYQTSVERFPTRDAFLASLKAQKMNEEGWKHSLIDEIKCDKVMDLVSQDVPALDKTKAVEYYEKNRLEFSRAKIWEMSQILITINNEYAENTRPNALARIRDIYKQSDRTAFSKLALQHSECPSALENGYLGWCEEGKLYPEITNALYTLHSGQISGPIETEIGFHLVQFHDEKPARVATFEEVWPFLQEKHATRARKFIQKQWINQLLNQH